MAEVQQSQQVYKFPKETQKCIGERSGPHVFEELGSPDVSEVLKSNMTLWECLGLEIANMFVLFWGGGP